MEDRHREIPSAELRQDTQTSLCESVTVLKSELKKNKMERRSYG